MSTGLTNNCCTPQLLSVTNPSGYLAISDGNSVYLGTMIRSLGIKTPVVNFVLNGYIITLTYTDSAGNIQSTNIDLSGLAQGGSFVADNSPTVDLTYSNSNLTADVNVSSQESNALVINPDGLYVPQGAQTPLTANNSATITLSATGTNNMTLSANLNISANPSNKIQVASDGLLVQDMTTYILQGSGITLTGVGTSTSPYTISANAAQQTPISVNDSTSLHLVSSGTYGTTLTGNVKVSTLTANAIVVNNDGLYVPQASTGSYTDAQARLALSVNAPLTYNNQTGVFGIVQATASTSGYLANNDWNTFNNKITTGASIGSSSSVPVYAGQNGTTLNFNGIRGGTNVSIVQIGNDIVISAAGSGGGGGTGSTTFNLDFIVGDGGAYTPVANASQFNPAGNPLAGKTVLGFFIEGIKTAGVPRTGGQTYFTFTSSSGAITLTNGVFSADTYYSILYR